MRLVTTFAVVGALLASCASAEKGQGEAKPVHEIAAGAARLHGGGIRMDVQVGRTLTTEPGKTSTVTIAPNAVVTP